MSAVCGACTVELNREVETTTRRLLAGLDEPRRARLTEAYQGQAPEVLCAACMLASIAVINRVAANESNNAEVPA